MYPSNTFVCDDVTVLNLGLCDGVIVPTESVSDVDYYGVRTNMFYFILW